MTHASPKARTVIVVDSAASLPPDAARHPQVLIVPMRLVFDGKTYLDGRDIAPDEFYRMLKQSAVPPTTSAPSPGDYLEVFKRAAEKHSAVLCLTVASRFSASFKAAESGTMEARTQLPGVEITVLDSGSAAGGEGLIALEGLRVASEGGALSDVAEAAKEVMPRVRLLAFLDTLYYLWKGGRVPRIAHAGTSLLRIKPTFELAQGEVRTIARPRTHRRAMSQLIDSMRERIQPASQGRVHATVMHAADPDSAEQLRQRIAAEFPCETLFVSAFTPVMGAHTGPGLLGVAFWTDTDAA